MLGKYLPSDQSHHVFTDKWFNTHATTEAILEIGHDVTGAMDRHKYAQVFDRRLEHARDDTMGHTATHRRYITKDGTPHVISANGVVFPHITPQKKQLQGFLSTAMHGSMIEEGNVKSLDVLQAYNENKRSVDTFNQMVREIEFPHKSRRFAFPLLTFCCNAAIVNSLAAYIHTEHACVSVRQVAEAIARELVPEQKGCILSSIDHKLVCIDSVRGISKSTCTYCRQTAQKSSQTMYMCMVCYPHVYLHKKCFDLYHTLHAQHL